MAYLSGEARARLDAFKAVMVKHARLEEIDAALRLLIEEPADSTHVLLCVPGGVGKSTVLKGVTERFTREEPNRAVVPIVLLEPIPSDTGPYVRLDYYRQIASALKGHILVKELYVNVGHLMTTPKSARVRADSTEWLDMRRRPRKRSSVRRSTRCSWMKGIGSCREGGVTRSMSNWSG
jgi:hypothetical protein